jgi:hypothetical protein
MVPYAYFFSGGDTIRNTLISRFRNPDCRLRLLNFRPASPSAGKVFSPDRRGLRGDAPKRALPAPFPAGCAEPGAGKASRFPVRIDDGVNWTGRAALPCEGSAAQGIGREARSLLAGKGGFAMGR